MYRTLKLDKTNKNYSDGHGIDLNSKILLCHFVLNIFLEILLPLLALIKHNIEVQFLSS